MTRDIFERLVAEGIQAVPQKFLDKLSNVAVVVEDEPTEEQLKHNHVRRGWIPYESTQYNLPNVGKISRHGTPYSRTGWTLFGLYEGVPQTARGSSYGWVLPDKITIFQKPIEEAERSPEEIKEIVKDTVWHEIAHHFGMNEGEVRTRERMRKKL